jgi:hypothetical protein
MKKMIASVGTALTLAVLSLSALAQQPSQYNINARQANQERRIDQGVRSGELTPRETRRLERGQNHINRMEDRAKADGVVTPREHRRIAHAQNRQSRRIFRAKHNYRVRY